MISKLLALIALLLAVGLLATGCGPQRTLVGQWQQVGASETLEFTANGQVIAKTDKGLITGNYELLDKNRVLLKLAVLGQSSNSIWGYRFEEGTLVLTEEGTGKSTTYVRISSSAATPRAANSSLDLPTIKPPMQPRAAGVVQTLKQDVEKQVTNNLRQVAAAADQYFLEHGASSVTARQLIGPETEKYIRSLTPVDGENYLDLTIRQGEPISVTTRTGLVVTYRN